MSGMFDLDGKVALITGAGWGGLGAFSAIALAEHGCKVALADLSSRNTELSDSSDKIRSSSENVMTITVDVTKETDVNAAVESVLNHWGRIDILLNNAGVMLRKSAFDTTVEEWQRIIDINLTGTWLMSRRVGKELVKQSSGKIINISSLYSNIVGPLPESAYYASKAGVVNLTRGLALEWGPHGVQVNCIAPGVFYPTNMTKPLVDQPERLEWMAKRTMLGRLGNPERDLKGAVVFLASAASDYITGQLLAVDGGWTAW